MEGGRFFFTDSLEDEKGESAEAEVIEPTCGRMLAYSSGFENIHGVTGLKKGQRCLLTLWLTPDIRKV